MYIMRELLIMHDEKQWEKNILMLSHVLVFRCTCSMDFDYISFVSCILGETSVIERFLCLRKLIHYVNTF